MLILAQHCLHFPALQEISTLLISILLFIKLLEHCNNDGEMFVSNESFYGLYGLEASAMHRDSRQVHTNQDVLTQRALKMFISKNDKFVICLTCTVYF